MQQVQIQKRRNWDITITTIVCALESLTKGWMSLLLAPISIVALPLFVVLQLAAKRQFGSKFGKPIRFTSYALTVSMLCTYVLMVGGGDTDDVLAFGFYKTSVHNGFVMALDKVAYFGFWGVTPAIFVLLVVLLLVNRFKR